MRSHDARSRRADRSLRTAHSQSPGQVFRIPIWIGVLSAVGLVTALVGDDAWDAASWLTLLVPIVAATWGWRRRQ